MPILAVGALEKRPVAPFTALALVAVRPGAQGPSLVKNQTSHPEGLHCLKIPPWDLRATVPNSIRVRFPSFPDSILHLNVIRVKRVNVVDPICCGRTQIDEK